MDVRTENEGESRGLLFREEVHAIQGAVFEVYRHMGCGFLERIYQQCLEREFELRGLPFAAQKEFGVSYKGVRLGLVYVADFVCHDAVVVEVKATKEIAPEHRAQILNYLKLSGLRVGLLVNFGHYPKATVERFVL